MSWEKADPIFHKRETFFFIILRKIATIKAQSSVEESQRPKPPHPKKKIQ